MRFILTVIILLSSLGSNASAQAGEQEVGDSVSGKNLHEAVLSDGAILRIGIESPPGGGREEVSVDAALYSRQDAMLWRAFDVLSVEITHEPKLCYALVGFTDDHVFLFATWNGRYCIIQKRTGQIVKKGNGDELLGVYKSFVPLKLTLGMGLRSTMTKTLVGTEAIEARNQLFKERRDRSAFFRCQHTPGTRLEKGYVIQFDADADGRSAPGRHPLFVIAWKAERIGAVSFGFGRSVADVSIHDRPVRPSSTKKAIYVLQPDYSLQELPLTAEEIDRLFSHIARSEVQIDQRVASLRGRKGPDWIKEASSIEELEQIFPFDPDWEHLVNSRLKVVEPRATGLKNTAGWH